MRPMIRSLHIVLFAVIMQTQVARGYTGYGFYIEKPYIAPIYINDDGRITIGERIDVGGVGAERLVVSPRGTHVLVLCNNFRNLKLDKKGAVFSNELIDLEGHPGHSAISPSGRYALLKNVLGIGLAYIHVYRIHDDDTMTSTGHFYDLSSLGFDLDIKISPIRSTVIATRMGSIYGLGVLRLTDDERLIDTGQRIFTDPFYALNLSMSPDGRICANQDLNYINLLRIADDGMVSYHSEYIVFYSTACRVPVFTADGKYMLAPEYSPAIFAGLHSYMIFRDGGFKMVDELAGFDFIDRVALTPDEKYAFLASDYTGFMGEGTQVLSVVRVYPDGTLRHMLSDITVPGCFASVVFPPPWLLAEYGVQGDELADFGEWSAGGAPASFSLPTLDRASNGMPELRATSLGPCFGFWQSPENACMIVPRSLYRARFVISTRQDGITAEEESFSEDYPYSTSSDPLPTLRMRIGTQNQHQAAALNLNTLPEDWLAPTPEGMAYEVLIKPPFSLLRQEEDLDDLFLALDLLGFAPDVDRATSIVLEKAWVDRIPIDALTTAGVVCDYSFEDGPEGWTSGGARELLTEPIARWTKGALVLEATTNTDCFGFWQNPAGDIVTSTGAELYRATFEVKRPGVTDIVHGPVFRVRLNSDDGKLAAVLTVGGTVCEEEAEWTALKSYALYYLKPQTPEPMQLRLAFDLLNYDPYAPPDATLELHHVTMERLELPCFPMDR